MSTVVASGSPGQPRPSGGSGPRPGGGSGTGPKNTKTPAMCGSPGRYVDVAGPGQ